MNAFIRNRRLIPSLVLSFAAAALTLGLLRGEAGIVFRKAAMICLECIGIG